MKVEKEMETLWYKEYEFKGELLWPNEAPSLLLD